MNTEQDIICRLCLKGSDKGFLLIDETVKLGLGVLSVNMNFDVSNNPLMCEGCAEIVKKSLSFILACLEAEKMIALFDTREDTVSIDLRDVYAHKSKEIVSPDSFICRFCMMKVEEEGCIPLNVLMKENAFIDAVKGCMSMMGLSIIKNSLICFHCRDSMDGYIKFLQNCADKQGKIDMYAQISKVEKEERVWEEATEIESTYINNMIEKKYAIKNKGIDNFLHHNGNMSDRTLCTCDTKVSSCLGCRVTAHEAVSVTDNIKIEAVLSEINEELEIKSEELNIKDEVTLVESTRPMRKSVVCVGNKKRESCSQCNSEFEIVSTRPTLYKCKPCKFQGIRIKLHMLKHRDVSDVVMYKCTTCDFKTKHKSSLKCHLLTHKSEAETTMYKCTTCEFKTKHKNYLKTHVLIHKTEAEIMMYKCTVCDYKTIRKNSLNKHSLIHKTEAEVTMYKCTACDHQTKYKSYLRRHLLRHKKEAEMYKCTTCDFKTNRRQNMRYHLYIHKIEAEVATYKCPTCDYRTNRESTLRSHVVIHRTKAVLPRQYKCRACGFKTKCMQSLRNHLMTHNGHRPV